jgi:hypothetical protein
MEKARDLEQKTNERVATAMARSAEMSKATM